MELESILIPNKEHSKPKLVRREKGHFKLKKGLLYQEDITIKNIYPIKIGVPNFIKQLCIYNGSDIPQQNNCKKP
jgi:hypothetical protein